MIAHQVLPALALALSGGSASSGEAPLTLVELQSMRLSASSFFEVSRESAPGTTYVIDRQQLATSTGRTLADVIDAQVPGMQVSKHLWTGALVGVRGITVDNNAKTLVMLDGLNLNMRTHFGTHGLLSLPLMDDIERIEVGNGPGALVHGAGAINGYVDLAPKDGARHPGLRALFELGPVDAYGSAQLSYGFSYGHTSNLYLYAGVAAAAGYRPRANLDWSCTGPVPYAPCPHDAIRARDLGPTYKLMAHWKHGDLDLLALFIDARLSTEGNALSDWYRFEDPHWLSALLALRPQYTASFTEKEDLVLSASVQLQDYGFLPRHPRRDEVIDQRLVAWNGPARVGRESWTSLRLLLKTIRLPGSSLAVGGELGHRSFDRNRRFFGGGDGPLLGLEEADFNWVELATFVEDTFRWQDLSVTGGLRFEYFRNPASFQPDTYTEATTGETVTPRRVDLSNQRAVVARLGVAWAATPDTTVKASFQQGFRNPDASYYTHWAAREAIKERAGLPGLPALSNETMDSFELNVTQNLTPAAVAYLAAYHNRYHNLLAWNAKEETFLNGQDDIRAIGGELGADVVVAGGLRAGLSYGHSRPLGYSRAAYALLALTSSDRASWKVYSPHQVKATVGHTLLGGALGWTLSAAFYGRVDDPAWAAGRGDRYLVHAAVRYELTRQIHAKLVLQNLAGNTVPPPRLDNDRTQNGHLGLDQRLLYLSLGVQVD